MADELFITGIRFKDSKEEIHVAKEVLSLQHIHNYIPLSEIQEVEEVQCDCHSVTGSDGSDGSDGSNSTDTEYCLYSRVETHMNISMSLYMLNKQGIEILQELETKKLNIPLNSSHNIKKKEATTFASISTVHHRLSALYQSLINIVTYNKYHTHPYTELLNLLDSMLFDECSEVEQFYVNEDGYNLENIYYKQEAWISELEGRETVKFLFSEAIDIQLGESSYIVMYLKKYIGLLDMILATFENERIEETVSKFRHTLNTAVSIAEEWLMNKLISDNDEV
jgi:hypothetical protein